MTENKHINKFLKLIANKTKKKKTKIERGHKLESQKIGHKLTTNQQRPRDLCLFSNCYY